MYYSSAVHYSGKKVSSPGVRFGLLPDHSLSFVSVSPRHYTGQPHLSGDGEMRPCGELKLVTTALLGGLYVTEGGCLFGVGYPWVFQ